MSMSILAFVLSVIYFLYNYNKINYKPPVINTPVINKPVIKKIIPVLANARGGNYERIYTNLKSKLIKNKEKRVRFNEEVRILNEEINRQNEEIDKAFSMI